MGATPMIGRNDVQGEVFSLGDAHALVSFAKKMHLARVSIWSANRDSQCGVQSIDDQVSNTCSGVAAEPARVHLGARPAERQAPGARDGPGAARRVAASDPRQPGDEPVPDLARDEGLPAR